MVVKFIMHKNLKSVECVFAQASDVCQRILVKKFKFYQY